MKKSKITIGSILKALVIIFVAFVTLYPFLYMICVSLSDNIYVLQNKISFYPRGFTLRMYEYILGNEKIWTAYKNTIIYTSVGTTVSLLLTSMGAYALSKKYKLQFCKQYNLIILFTMFFGGGMIPNFLNVRSLGLLDTIWAMVLPSCISAWNLIVMRSFFQSYPAEIEDSGYVDGLNDFGVFCYLVLPTSKAVLATIGLFYAVGYWNMFVTPYLYLESPEKYPLQVVLRDIVLAGLSIDEEMAKVQEDIMVEDSLKFATIIISVIPIIAVYPFVQKYFVKGVMVGSIKG